jgi:hypothetical protein
MLAREETKTRKCFKPVQKRKIGSRRFLNPPPTNIDGSYYVSVANIYLSVT